MRKTLLILLILLVMVVMPIYPAKATTDGNVDLWVLLVSGSPDGTAGLNQFFKDTYYMYYVLRNKMSVESDGNRHLCQLISAEHSTLGKVLPELLKSDDVKAKMLLLETIDLTFVVPYQNVQDFTFVIEGNNMLKP